MKQDSTQAYPTVIIGAGLTGLVTAFYLRRAGHSVRVIDHSSQPGGVIHTLNENGFVFEAGPNTGVLSHPEIAELFEDLGDRCQLETANAEAKKRWILKKGIWHALPAGPMEAIKTPLFTFGDKLRIFGEPFRGRGTNPDESVADLVVRRLGRSYLNFAVDPFISGIYAGDPSKLVTRYALPKLYNLEQKYGSFIRGAIRKKSEPVDPRMNKATREVFSAQGGLQRLIDALVDAIGPENLLSGVRDVRVLPVDSIYEVSWTEPENQGRQSIKTSQIVSTIGSYALRQTMPFVEEHFLNDFEGLRYARIVQVALGYNQWKGIPIKAFGGLIPSSENRNILGILFPSSFFVGRAPQGGAMLSVFLGGVKRGELVDWSDDQIAEMVKKEVADLLQTGDHQPDLLRIFRYEHAIPQYERSAQACLEAVKSIETRYPGLLIAGNLRNGIGMGDRIKQGAEIARQILQNESGRFESFANTDEGSHTGSDRHLKNQ